MGIVLGLLLAVVPCPDVRGQRIECFEVIGLDMWEPLNHITQVDLGVDPLVGSKRPTDTLMEYMPEYMNTCQAYSWHYRPIWLNSQMNARAKSMIKNEKTKLSPLKAADLPAGGVSGRFLHQCGDAGGGA